MTKLSLIFYYILYLDIKINNYYLRLEEYI